MVAIKRLITFRAIDTCRLLFAALAIFSSAATNFVRMTWKVHNEKKGRNHAGIDVTIMLRGL